MRTSSTQLELELDALLAMPALTPTKTPEELEADLAEFAADPEAARVAVTPYEAKPAARRTRLQRASERARRESDTAHGAATRIKAYPAEPLPVAKNPYEEKQAARRARLERGAERARRDSRISGAIPVGQPVGHHSDRPYRQTLAKAAMGKGVEARAAAVRTAGIPLYNHTNPGTAYLVDDYPYGFKARCRIRYWIESDPKKGFRFVSQTERPGTSHWNAPKKSTYYAFGACMYLDENGHVQVRGLSEYATAEETLAFVRDFPGAELSRIRQWVTAKAAYVQGCLDGRIVVRINGEVRPWTEADQERHRAELAIWRHAGRLLAK